MHYPEGGKASKDITGTPKTVIGQNRVSIQSGIIYGYAGLVDELVERMKKRYRRTML